MFDLLLLLQDAATTMGDTLSQVADQAQQAAGALSDAASQVDPSLGADPNLAADPAIATDPSLVQDGGVTAPVPDAAAAVAATEEVANPYSLQALWSQGDLVARGTLVMLVIMSLGTWYILFLKFLEQQRILRQAKTAVKNFWAASSMQDGLGGLKENSAFRAVAEDGLRAVEQHQGSLSRQLALSDWIALALNQSVDGINQRLQGGLSFLATVGSTAPFVGLFGTVWGIYHALVAIGLSGQASIDKVAGPVGEALIMTAIGLAVAVPAVLAYNWLVRRNKVVLENIRGFSSNIYAYLLSGSPEAGSATSAKVAAARSH